MGLILKAISDLNDYSFTVPYLQRGYRWKKENVIALIDDLYNFMKDDSTDFYCLQPLTILGNGKIVRVIDGQQRLTTIFLILKYLRSLPEVHTNKLPSYSLSFERDQNEERKTFLNNPIDSVNYNNIDYFHISQAYITISSYELLKINAQKFVDLFSRSKGEKSVQFIWYDIVSSNKEHSSFEDLNSGKIHLSNADLIKALLLNRTNGYANLEQIAAQYDEVQKSLENDRLWYMLRKESINQEKGQSRMDILFNYVAGVNSKEYDIDNRASFNKFAKYDIRLLREKWDETYETFLRLKDLSQDPYSFHFIGFLTYCRDEDASIKWIVDMCKSNTKEVFISNLQRKVWDKVKKYDLDSCAYGIPSNADLRRIFVIHNIMTILKRYKELQKEEELRFYYEYFPFELLNTRTWNIEHIASHTDNSLEKEDDRKDWLESIEKDYGEFLHEEKYKELSQLIISAKNSLSDTALFKKVKGRVELFFDDNKVENKNGLGNLILLDEHTNKYFHNSLFPKKRRIVLIADGGGLHDEKGDIRSVFVPLCTKQAYLKSYNKSSNVSLMSWDQDDYDAYLADIKEKINSLNPDK